MQIVVVGAGPADDGRVRGVTWLGGTLTAEWVIDASGRASKFTSDVRAPAEGGDCGAVYIDRQYRFHADVSPGPVNSPMGLLANLDGYQLAGPVSSRARLPR